MKTVRVLLLAVILLLILSAGLAAKPRLDKGSLDVRTLTQPSKEELLAAVEGTPLTKNVDDIIKASTEYKVNAVLLAAIIVHETGWGTSQKYKKLKNVAGIKRGPGYKKFASHKDSIMMLAKILFEDYTTPGGRYYKGPRLKDINYYYCTTKSWAPKVEDIIRRINKKMEGFHAQYRGSSEERRSANYFKRGGNYDLSLIYTWKGCFLFCVDGVCEWNNSKNKDLSGIRGSSNVSLRKGL